MKQTRKKTFLLFYSIFLLCLQLTGCGSNSESSAPSSQDTQNSAGTDFTTETSESISNEKGTRDNTPMVLTPEASGSTIHACEQATLDVSNLTEGYIMANYTGSAPKVKLQIKGPEGTTYTYNLHGESYEVFPLTCGNGTYTIGVYENVADTTYSIALSTDIDVTLDNELGCYLYPNQYVNFNALSLPVKKAEELAFSSNSDIEVVEQVYNYIIEHFTYDYDKAQTVVSGYLPIVDDVYNANTGICFDYAAVMATMLRSQNIPTRLEVGYVGEQYHAWISIYLKDMGWINGIIEFNGTDWNMLDPTFASTSKSPRDFITENSTYLTKYVY